MKIRIGRHINGITLNPLEYVMDDDKNIMLFENEKEAKDFLIEKCAVNPNKKDFDGFYFEEHRED